MPGPLQDPILVQALFDLPLPPLDVEILAAALTKSFGRAEIVGSDDDGDGQMIAFHDLPTAEIEGRRVPTTISFLPAREFAQREALEQSVRQTWDWPEAKRHRRSSE